MGEIKMKWSELTDFSDMEKVEKVRVKIFIEMTNTMTIIDCSVKGMNLFLNHNPYTTEISFDEPLKIISVKVGEK